MAAIYTIEQLNGYIERLLCEEEVIHNICVRGEVSGFSVSGKTAFFVLKDAAAQLSCIMYDYKLSPYLPKDGEKAVLTGTPQFSKKYGSLKFSVSHIKPLGKGELYEQFLKLKAALRAEGLFDTDRKRAVPQDSRRIAVITSAEGAVVHDIITTVMRRNPFCDVLIYPVKVQGLGADAGIAAAISTVNSNKNMIGAGVMIIARGGGSQEDLEVFNTETVARAVAASLLPVVSAVGHETDITLCDMAADLRAATPTAAAVAVTADIYGIIGQIRIAAANMARSFNNFYSKRYSALYASAETMNRLFENIFKAKHGALISRAAKLRMLSDAFINEKLNALNQSKIRLEKSNPLKLLESGYAKLFAKAPVYSVGQLTPGDDLDVYLRDGVASTKVNAIKRI